MRVGILGGTGPLGRGLALRLAASGTEVVIGSRDAARASSLVDDLLKKWSDRVLLIEGAANAAASDADVVVAATPWDSVVPTARELSDHLAGKVVISVGSALLKLGREMQALVAPRGSVAADLQAALPDALIAAACHHLPAGPLGNLREPLDADVLVCSDHSSAREATIGLLGRIEGLRPVDAGSLATAGPVEGFTAVLVSLNMRHKTHTSMRLSGLDHLWRPK